MLPDYHWHTARCGHATGEMEQYVRAAKARGLKEVGFADHIPMYWLGEKAADPSLAMGFADLPVYINDVMLLRVKHPDLRLRLGLEVDYIPGQENRAKEIISKYDFDYIIGSVHYLNGWGFDDPRLAHRYSDLDIREIYCTYFHELVSSALCGIFDIIAHPDLIKKFGHRPEHEPLDLYRQAAKAFADAGVCMEVNTAGLRNPAGEIYPSFEFLKICREYNVPVATGSDAHKPGQVGADFDLARQLLVEAGYNQVAVFEGRRRIFINI